LDKYTWTLVRDEEASERWVLNELGDAVGDLIPGVTDARVTLQAPGALLNATAPVEGVEQPIDMVLEVTTSDECPRLDPFLAYLGKQARHVQGWRVKPTLIYDATRSLERGERSDAPNVLVFVQRLDGTTPEHFDRNWYQHAGHADGTEAETEQARMERAREEAERPGGLYRQNRVREAVTPTAWLVHGYTQLQLGMLVPEVPTDPYERTRGEDAFDRWPPRMVQGPELRVR
jgi:hypothetical protein